MSNNQKLTDWRSDTPAMIGEYNASRVRSGDTRRWWDGKKWSAPYYHTKTTEREKRRCRRQKAITNNGIEWRGLTQQPKDFVEPQPLGPL